jgi:hypothetical protein
MPDATRIPLCRFEVDREAVMRPLRLDARDERTTATAKAVVEQQSRERDERTARLRALRLARDTSGKASRT